MHTFVTVEAQSAGSSTPGTFAGKCQGCNFLGVHNASGKIARPVQFRCNFGPTRHLGQGAVTTNPNNFISHHVYTEAQQFFAPM
jgi:hypothetical protein